MSHINYAGQAFNLDQDVFEQTRNNVIAVLDADGTAILTIKDSNGHVSDLAIGRGIAISFHDWNHREG